MKTKYEVRSIRLPVGMVEQLRALARRAGLKRGKNVSWCDLARETLAAKITTKQRGKR